MRWEHRLLLALVGLKSREGWFMFALNMFSMVAIVALWATVGWAAATLYYVVVSFVTVGYWLIRAAGILREEDERAAREAAEAKAREESYW
jgi:ABC-type sulfate transport system permease component